MCNVIMCCGVVRLFDLCQSLVIDINYRVLPKWINIYSFAEIECTTSSANYFPRTNNWGTLGLSANMPGSGERFKVRSKKNYMWALILNTQIYPHPPEFW